MEKKIAPYPISENIWMVPCYSNLESNSYQPICFPLNSSTGSLKINFRVNWATEEDKVLESLIKKYGNKAWAGISREINKIFHNGNAFRNGRQCRERYYNHINPSLKKGNWKIEEDLHILEMQSTNGNKWSKIAKSLPGRNENQVKNRWKSLVNKKFKKKNWNLIKPTPVSPNTSFINYESDSNFFALSGMIQAQYYSLINDPKPQFNSYFA
jgi:Myb-like DNA-binding domain